MFSYIPHLDHICIRIDSKSHSFDISFIIRIDSNADMIRYEQELTEAAAMPLPDEDDDL